MRFAAGAAPAAATPVAASGSTKVNLTLNVEGVKLGLDGLSVNLTGLRLGIEKLTLIAEVGAHLAVVTHHLPGICLPFIMFSTASPALLHNTSSL